MTPCSVKPQHSELNSPAANQAELSCICRNKLSLDELGDWQRYLAQSEAEHHAYEPAWGEVLASVFKHEPYYLLARRQDQLVGVLPLVHVQSKLFGSSLISVPYLNGGGALAFDNEALFCLLENCQQLAQTLDVDYVELRQRSALADLPENWQSRSHKVAMKRKLCSDPEELFSSFKAKLRSQVRRPSKSGITATVIEAAKATPSDIQSFYEVFSQNMRDLGTPVYPLSLFSQTLAKLKEQAMLVLVQLEQQPVGAAILVGSKDSLEIPWASTLRRFNSMSPNMLLYWTCLKHACEKGYSYFDFGRCSPEGPTFKFKAQWGSEPQELHWYYFLRRGALPDVNPQSPKFRAAVSCWKRMPLWLANRLGPFLTKSLP